MSGKYEDLSPKRQAHIAIQAYALSMAVEELARIKETSKDVVLIILMLSAQSQFDRNPAQILKFIEWFDKHVEQFSENERIIN